MPNIQIQTNLTITPEMANELKASLGKAIETIPGKSERWLMVVLEDNKTMYFQGSDAPCALASVELLGSASDATYDNMTEVMCKTLAEKLSVPADRIYVKYTEFSHWGWNGSNF
jgi:hypothetical protein